jgi:hypothetical protein
MKDSTGLIAQRATLMISDSIGEIHISVIDGEAEEWHEIVRMALARLNLRSKA